MQLCRSQYFIFYIVYDLGHINYKVSLNKWGLSVRKVIAAKRLKETKLNILKLSNYLRLEVIAEKVTYISVKNKIYLLLNIINNSMSVYFANTSLLTQNYIFDINTIPILQRRTYNGSLTMQIFSVQVSCTFYYIITLISVDFTQDFIKHTYY